MQFPGPSWAHTAHLLVAQVQLSWAGEATARIKPSTTPNRGSIVQEKSTDKVLNDSRQHPKLYSPDGGCSFLHTGVPLPLLIQIRPTKQVLLPKQLASPSQIPVNSFPAPCYFSGSGTCLQLPPSLLLDEERTGKKEKQPSSCHGLPLWIKDMQLALFLL